MASEVINLVATLSPQPDKAEELSFHLAQLTREVNANEPNTLIYHSFHNKAKNEFVVVEKYKNQAALKAHMESPYVKAFASKVGGMMAKPVEIKKGELLPLSVGVARI
ncbi:hypothetical protein AWENTII_012347 [Aspergillus wentii]|nr:hypothetical protein MW887_002841 [Aspergillus wentii]